MLMLASLGLTGGDAMAESKKVKLSPTADIGIEPGAKKFEELDPKNFGRSENIDHAWWPLKPGTQWVFDGYTEEEGKRTPHRLVFTVTDLTRPATQTVMLYVGRLIYPAARLWVQTDRVLSVSPPPAGTRLWQFTGSHLTTYGGVHGTVLGPWQTSTLIKTSDGTPAGTVVASPSGLSNGGQDFSAWLRHQ